MQTVKNDPHVTIVGRHIEITDAIRDYAEKKVDSLRLEYPRIIETRVILDVQKLRHKCEIHLFCSNHIVIDASSTQDDLYAAIDDTIRKIARRMRKYHTRLLKRQHPRKDSSIRYFDEKYFVAETFDLEAPVEPTTEETPEPEPYFIHREAFRLRTLSKEDAITELELSEKPFVLYRNERRDVLQIVYKRPDGDYTIVELGESI